MRTRDGLSSHAACSAHDLYWLRTLLSAFCLQLHLDIEKAEAAISMVDGVLRSLYKQAEMSAAATDAMVTSITQPDRGLQQVGLHYMLRCGWVSAPALRNNANNTLIQLPDGCPQHAEIVLQTILEGSNGWPSAP